MAKTTPRLHVATSLSEGAEVRLDESQAHYLSGVLRLSSGDAVSIFNGQDGEFLSFVAEVAKKKVLLRVERLVSAVKPAPDIDYCFAPLKHARLDYVVQKACELGARRLRPIITARTIAERVNLDRMRANVIEAAEQCNLVFVPEVLEPVSLQVVLRDWDMTRNLIYCDEAAPQGDAHAALSKLKLPAAVLIGPEGGFTLEEQAHLRSLSFVTAVSLGPRIMRADTAGVAILTLAQSILGDW